MLRLNSIPLLWETWQAGMVSDPSFQSNVAVSACSDRKIDIWCVIA